MQPPVSGRTGISVRAQVDGGALSTRMALRVAGSLAWGTPCFVRRRRGAHDNGVSGGGREAFALAAQPLKLFSGVVQPCVERTQQVLFGLYAATEFACRVKDAVKVFAACGTDVESERGGLRGFFEVRHDNLLMTGLTADALRGFKQRP